MPGLDDIQTTAALCREFPQARVVVLSTFQGGDDILRAMQAGAKTYLPKSVQREELIKAVRAIARGETYLPNVVAGRLAERLRRPDLTSRELEVLRLVAAGNSNKDIADPTRPKSSGVYVLCLLEGAGRRNLADSIAGSVPYADPASLSRPPSGRDPRSP